MTAALLAEATPVPSSPPEVFGFGPEESDAMARKLTEDHLGREVPRWDRVRDAHESAKGPLISLFSTPTRRLAIPPPPAQEPTASSRTLALQNAMLAVGLYHWKDYFGESSFDANWCMTKAGASAFGRKGIAEGMKVSRALAALVAGHYGNVSASINYHPEGREIISRWKKKNDTPSCPENSVLAPILADEVMKRAREPRATELVLSGNTLDLLMMSDHCCFYSCLAPDGDWRAGPRQYHADAHTILAYASPFTRCHERLGVALPYKTWRQTVHVDLAGGAAYFMKPYIGEVGADRHKGLRRAVASILARNKNVTGHENADWYDASVYEEASRGKITIACPVEKAPAGLRMASIDDMKDGECYRIRLKDGGTFRKLHLAWPVPCPGCDRGDIAKHCSLVCDACQ